MHADEGLSLGVPLQVGACSGALQVTGTGVLRHVHRLCAGPGSSATPHRGVSLACCLSFTVKAHFLPPQSSIQMIVSVATLGKQSHYGISLH